MRSDNILTLDGHTSYPIISVPFDSGYFACRRRRSTMKATYFRTRGGHESSVVYPWVKAAQHIMTHMPLHDADKESLEDSWLILSEATSNIICLSCACAVDKTYFPEVAVRVRQNSPLPTESMPRLLSRTSNPLKHPFSIIARDSRSL